MRNRLLALLCAAFVAALTLYGVGAFDPRPANAFSPPKTRPPTAEEVRIFKDVIRLTREGGTETNNTARRVIQRHLLKSAPRAAPAIAGTAGLVGAAAGVWTVVGLELYYLPCWECQTESVKVAAEQAVAPGAISTTAGTNPGGAQGFLTYVGGERQPNGGIQLRYGGFRNVTSWKKTTLEGGEVQWEAGTPVLYPLNVTLPAGYENPWSIVRGTGAAPPAYKPKVMNQNFYIPNNSVTVRFSGHKLTDTVVCASSTPCITREFPTLDSGSMTEGGTSTTTPFKSTPDEGNNIIGSVVADPETETLPVTPDAPPDWDTLPPPPPDPYENPDADPDQDGTPNRNDEDPEGDGDPDGDGDPNEHVPLYPAPTSPDTDDDGVPDTDDPDIDGDGVPNEVDPNPGTWDPPPDADKDGDPDKTDPDDDNDGIPDTEDPEPTVPTDPTTLPPDHPYADPDGDGLPNKDDGDDDGDTLPDETDPNPTVSDPDTDGDGERDPVDPDDDNDGTPDEGDTAPTNPDEGGDLDRDGIPDLNDGDQDGDGTADWEDTGTRDRGVPVPPGEVGPDLDDDGVPDWSDPWPGNPYAPEDPTKDGDLDKVPDYKDPVIGDPSSPMQPWPPGSPGDSPGNPGQPNIPPNPENPNYPTSPNKPAQPSDPTSTIDTTAPISPTEPMPPGEAGGPPAEEETATSCPIPRKPQVSVPDIKVANVFPFVLVVWGFDALAALHAPAEPPVFELPVMGAIDFGVMGGMLTLVNVVLTGLCLIGLVLGWYTYIRGSEA